MNEIASFSRMIPAPQEIRRPPIDEAAVRAAAIQPNGEILFAKQQVSQFESLNEGLYAAQADIEIAERRISGLASEAQQLKHRRDRTQREIVVVTAERSVTRAFFHTASALALLAGSGAALWMGINVGANYVVFSGSDLYATNPDGAKLFMGASVMASLLLKTWEARLPHDHAKAIFNAVIVAIGIGAFVVWAVAMAVAFAPAQAAEVTWLVAGGGSRWTSIALLLAHVLIDVAGSYGIFTGAEHLLLAGHQKTAMCNPLHQALSEQILGIEAEIDAHTRRRAAAEDYLRRFDAVRNDVEENAKLSVRRAILGLEQSRRAAVASTDVSFLAAL